MPPLIDEVSDAFSAWAKDAPAYPIPKERTEDIQRHFDRQRTQLQPVGA